MTSEPQAASGQGPSPGHLQPPRRPHQGHIKATLRDTDPGLSLQSSPGARSTCRERAVRPRVSHCELWSAASQMVPAGPASGSPCPCRVPSPACALDLVTSFSWTEYSRRDGISLLRAGDGDTPTVQASPSPPLTCSAGNRPHCELPHGQAHMTGVEHCLPPTSGWG